MISNTNASFLHFMVVVSAILVFVILPDQFVVGSDDQSTWAIPEGTQFHIQIQLPENVTWPQTNGVMQPLDITVSSNGDNKTILELARLEELVIGKSDIQQIKDLQRQINELYLFRFLCVCFLVGIGIGTLLFICSEQAKRIKQIWRSSITSNKNLCKVSVQMPKQSGSGKV